MMTFSFEELFRKKFGRAPTLAEMTILIDQSVTSHNQTGGITAHTVNIGPAKRTLDASLKAHLLQLPSAKPISVVAVLGNTESEEFAVAIHTFLRDAGFPMAEPGGISRGIFHGIVRGLSFDPEVAELTVGVNYAG